jgi:hypothetical protein
MEHPVRKIGVEVFLTPTWACLAELADEGIE